MYCRFCLQLITLFQKMPSITMNETLQDCSILRHVIHVSKVSGELALFIICSIRVSQPFLIKILPVPLKCHTCAFPNYENLDRKSTIIFMELSLYSMHTIFTLFT